LSYPAIRTYLKKQLSEQVLELYGKPDVIAGVATGAIGLGALVADYLDLPFVYVRPEPKKHGRQNQIEGTVESGQNVVVIEDLISTGKSSLSAVKALKEADANVLGMIAIFTYGFPIATQNFEQHQLALHTLSDYDCLLEHALESNFISPTELDILSTWSKAPQEWSL
jgi:orotate phosphoribosyltransferase